MYSNKNIPETQAGPAPQQCFPVLEPRPCYRCGGAIGQPTITVGTGPHAYKATCPHCHAFLQWVSRYNSAERIARRQHALRQAMMQRPPSAAQLAYLQALGYRGDPPTDRAAASVLIDQLQQERRL